ncbi:acetyltransferase, GNAT family [Aspergillus nomiae NRRL 13137]|uniref:Acetyltransferase, GNAT family n=1 Tax=Aspergillus nomiae NRRL (strain ATCC 15546 / NRRL 13137 / CBS 260.88 / M93) TaxID=1509407 RepID=A0A0L1IZR9_ASPN3|nr:acetyltransferase, GNAT family [Aspergillus nomiae NRRL 13137]KNG84915.1 acetyltransferase, GNAT family [Aspergillus nomiae NRRL 13137]
MSPPPAPTTPQNSNVARIPKEYAHQTDLEDIIARYRDLRLKGLKENPKAFSSKYEDEVEFPYEKWLARVTNPQARSFIAYDSQEDNKVDSLALLLSREWLGTVTIVGPRLLPEDNEVLSKTPWDVFLLPDERVLSEMESHNATLVYMLGGMFVLETGRRKGHGRRLIERAVSEVRTAATEAGASRLLVVSIVERNNDAARRLYQSCSFDVWDGELVSQISRHQECVAMVLDIRLEPGLADSAER